MKRNKGFVEMKKEIRRMCGVSRARGSRKCMLHTQRNPEKLQEQREKLERAEFQVKSQVFISALITSLVRGLKTHHVPDPVLGAGGHKWWRLTSKRPIKQLMAQHWENRWEQPEGTSPPLLSGEFL